MSTAKQIEANRANAAKSTGPRTAPGKSRASLNALKHGCTSQTMIFPGEDGRHFHAFHQSYIHDFQPQGALEQSLVQELAQTQWAINRCRAHEANLFALGHEKTAENINADGDQTIQAAFAGALVFKAESDILRNVSLYLQRHNRMFHATLKALREIQAARKSSRQAEFQRAVQYAHIHKQTQIPFNPAEFGFDCSPEEIAPFLRRETFLATHKKPSIHVSNAA